MAPWTERAACRPEVCDVDFFPDLSDRAGVEKAKAVCASCPVFDECDVASRRENFGVWAGAVRGGDSRCGTLLGYQNGCRCDRCHAVKSENHRRYRLRLIETLRSDPHDPRHGTNGYNVGCRCPKCKAASAELWRQKKEARVAS